MKKKWVSTAGVVAMLTVAALPGGALALDSGSDQSTTRWNEDEQSSACISAWQAYTTAAMAYKSASDRYKKNPSTRNYTRLQKAYDRMKQTLEQAQKECGWV